MLLVWQIGSVDNKTYKIRSSWRTSITLEAWQISEPSGCLSCDGLGNAESIDINLTVSKGPSRVRTVQWMATLWCDFLLAWQFLTPERLAPAVSYFMLEYHHIGARPNGHSEA